MSSSDAVKFNLKYRGGVHPMEEVATPENLAVAQFSAAAYAELLCDELDFVATQFPSLVEKVENAQVAIKVLISDISINNEMARFNLLATVALGLAAAVGAFVFRSYILEIKEDVAETKDMVDALVFLQTRDRTAPGLSSDRDRRIESSISKMEALIRERENLR